MLTQRFVIFFFGNFWLAYGNNSLQANLSSAEGLLWASDVQEATQRAQDEGDFVRCPGHLGFSPWSFTKSAGFIHLLWPIWPQTFMWVLRTTTNNCRVIFIDFRIVPLPPHKHRNFTGLVLWCYERTWVTCEPSDCFNLVWCNDHFTLSS